MIGRGRAGITWVEVLGLLLLVGPLLLGLIVFAARQSQLRHARVQSMNNLKQIGLALHGYDGANKVMPPAYAKQFPDRAVDGDFVTSIHVRLLPFLQRDEPTSFYQRIQAGQESQNVRVEAFLSPQDPTWTTDSTGIQNYAANLRVFSDKGRKTDREVVGKEDMAELAEIEGLENRPISQQFPDGTAYTIAFATKVGFCEDGGSMYAAAPNNRYAAFFGQIAARVQANTSGVGATFQLRPRHREKWLCHPLVAHCFDSNGILIGMADGSSRILTVQCSPDTWNNAMHPADGFTLGGW